MGGTTKDAILKASLRLFARDGFEAVSTSAIASELGMTKSALYKHFPDKRAIFDSLVDEMLEEHRAAVLSAGVALTPGTSAAQAFALMTAFSSKVLPVSSGSETMPASFMERISIFKGARIRRISCILLLLPVANIIFIFFSAASDRKTGKNTSSSCRYIFSCSCQPFCRYTSLRLRMR